MAKRERRDWTNDEVELLLKVTREYKVVKVAEDIDWESVKSKYGDILQRYHEHYPSPEEAITKGELTTKLKAIRLKYRKAVNLSRKRGYGQVVFLHSELCESIWGRPPADVISGDIEMGDAALEATESIVSSPEVAEDAVRPMLLSAEVMADQRQRFDASFRQAYGGTTEMVKSRTRDVFAWTDDEVELLLKVTNEYKAIKAAESIDWESAHGKYCDILELYLEHYPSPEEAMVMGKEYPHKKEDITKGQLTPKLKAIRFKYRKAVDSGRKHGHGRVVLLYYELCESIWGGSPATCAISEGLDLKTGDATMEVLEAVESTASWPVAGMWYVPCGEEFAEDTVSAELVADRPQRLDTSCRKSYGGTTAVAKSTTRDVFAWTNDEVELLLRVTLEYKTVKAAENIDWELEPSKYSDILELYLENYPSPEEAMAMGKEYPHKKDDITKDQLTPKLKAIRFKYRKAVNSGKKCGHGRVVLLYYELCESIWGRHPATPKGIQTDEAAVEMAKSTTRDVFAWTDDEVELLLKVTHEYKTVKSAKHIDWELEPSKYSDILELYLEKYPSPEEAMGKEYPHKKDDITKVHLTTKLKAIRFKYRKAVDSGRKHGHGRVVLLYYELCESIWGRPPATCAISEGFETGDTETEMTKSTTRDFFAWTDDEVELLLKVTLEYKTVKAAENIDWELEQRKYVDILELYLEHYPSPEEAMTIGKEYPHTKDDITKGHLTPKLKAIRFKYRKAVNSGRKHGHGRVVLLYYELCESIWGRPPATCAKSEGIKTGDATMEVLEAVESTASWPVAGMWYVPCGEEFAEDTVSAELVADRPQRLDTSCTKSYGGTTAVAKSTTRDFFAWTNDEVELLLRVTLEYKTVKAAENIDWELEPSKYSDILELYLEKYPSPEEGMGKEYPHKKDDITKVQLTPKLKAIRFKYRKAVNSGKKCGHGRVVLLYSELCESIWGGSPATRVISEGFETGDTETEMTKSTTRDFFAWTDDEMELLLKVTLEYKTVKAAENIDWESVHSKYADILELYLENYPSPEEAMGMGKEYPHTKDEITKGQLTTKIKAIRKKYRLAVGVGPGKKQGRGRAVLLYFELCESIWTTTRAISHTISAGIETGDVAAEAVGSKVSLPHAGSTPVPGGGGASETVASRRQSPDANLREKYRTEKLKRKLPTDPVAQEDLDIKRRLLQRLEVVDNEFVQTLTRWTSTLDRLNSNIELLLQHVVGSGTTQQTACSHGDTPTGRPAPRENHVPAHNATPGTEGVTLPSPPNSVEGENPVTSTEPTLSELMEELLAETSANTKGTAGGGHG